MKRTPFVMTPAHDLWPEFVGQLCHDISFQCSKNKIKSDCDSTTGRPFAKSILEDLGADVEASLTYFSKHGGYCDCEIIMNIAWCSPDEFMAKEGSRS